MALITGTLNADMCVYIYAYIFMHIYIYVITSRSVITRIKMRNISVHFVGKIKT